MLAPELLDRLPRACLEGAVFVALVAVICRLAPRLGARYRAALWWLASAKLLVALVPLTPFAVAVLPPTNSPAVADAAPTPVAVRVDVERFASPASGRTDPRTVLASLWAAGVTILFAASLPGVLRTRAWRRMGRPVDQPALAIAIERAAGAAGLRRVPEVRLVADLPGPLVVGLVRPTVLLPLDAPSRLSAAEMVMTLEHEMTHVARRDLWLGLVPAAARRILFFHPLAWLAEREYAIAREAACDEADVGRHKADVFAYGELLLRLAVARPATTATLSPRSALRRRLEMIETTVRRSPLHARVAWALVAVAAVALIPVRLVARETPEPPSPPAAPIAAAAPDATSVPEAPEPADAPEAETLPSVARTPAPPAIPRTAPSPDASAPRTPRPPAVPTATPAPMARSAAPIPVPTPMPRAVGTPMAAPAPPPPPPPVPGTPDAETPAPRAPRSARYISSSACLNLGDPTRSAFVILHDASRTMCGDPDDVRDAERARLDDDDLLWFRVDGDTYVIRDEGLIQRSLELLHVRRAAADKQVRIIDERVVAERQVDLARIELALAEQQERVQTEVVRRKASQADLERRSVEAARRVEKLTSERAELQRAQGQLDAEHAALAAELDARAAAKKDRLSRLLLDAIENGTAQEIH